MASNPSAVMGTRLRSLGGGRLSRRGFRLGDPKGSGSGITSRPYSGFRSSMGIASTKKSQMISAVFVINNVDPTMYPVVSRSDNSSKRPYRCIRRLRNSWQQRPRRWPPSHPHQAPSLNLNAKYCGVEGALARPILAMRYGSISIRFESSVAGATDNDLREPDAN